MQEILTALMDQQRELGGYVIGRGASALAEPSGCDGWSVADVLLHLAQTNEMAVASVEGRIEAFMHDAATRMTGGTDVDAWAGMLVDLERGTPEAARDRWVDSVRAQADAFATCDPEARLTWVAGELAARTLATTRLSEAWIHTGDVAVAFGEAPAPTERLWHVARLAWRTLPYALARGGLELHGPVGVELTAPDRSTWRFGMEADPPTVIRGEALGFCTVAGQRATAAEAGLIGTGPDATAVLALVRTFA